MQSCYRGIFPETVTYCNVMDNTIDSSDEGIHINQIVSPIHNVTIQGNIIRNTRAPMVFSGAFNSVLVIGNIINNYTYGAFAIGFNQGQCSGVMFDRNIVWPASNTVPIFIIPGGTQFLSYIKFGVTYLTERDSANPLPQSLFLSGSAAFTNLVGAFPAVISTTNPGPGKPEASGNYAYFGTPTLGTPMILGLTTATDNTDAKNKGVAVNAVYRTATGGLQIVY
jgi:hypothetical protein